MLSIQMINSPSKGTLRLLLLKIYDDRVKTDLQNSIINSIGLIQGQLAEIIAAGNVAEKASSVEIAEIAGTCPQHISIIGVFGETAAVLEAIKAVQAWSESNKNQWDQF